MCYVRHRNVYASIELPNCNHFSKNLNITPLDQKKKKVSNMQENNNNNRKKKI